MDSLIAKFFVYGTLQQGEARARFWPATPLRVEPAFALATLYDLGPCPAIVAGADRVRGELWSIAPSDVEATLRTLDAVEGFNRGGPNWYVRRCIDCYTFDERVHRAYAYYWATPETLANMPRIPPDKDGYYDWKSHRRTPYFPNSG